jgi:predicted dehydrogenase
MREFENNAAVAFRLDNGGTGTLRMDYLRPETAPTHGDDRLRIAGTRGVVEFQDPLGVTLITADGKPTQVTDLPPEEHLFADFLESLYAGKKHVISFDEVFRVSEIVLKARDAVESGTIVRL